MQPKERQLVQPNATPEQIKKWKEKALPFLSQSVQQQEKPSQPLLDLCPNPVPEFHEKLTVEQLLSSDFAKKLQQKSPKKLNTLLKKVASLRGGDPVYKWRRYASAIIIAAGANPDVVDAHSFSSLSNACLHQDIEMIDFLCEHGADPNKNTQEVTPASYVQNKYLAKLLHAYGALLQPKYLHKAMRHYSPELVVWLLKQGLDPNTQENTFYITPLHSFSFYIDQHTTDAAITKCKAFFDAGAKINIKNENGQTFLDIVKQRKAAYYQRDRAIFDAVIDCCNLYYTNICFLEKR